MRYALLIYGNENNDPAPGTPSFDEMMAGYRALNDEVPAGGAIAGGEALQSTATATTVRVRDGQTAHTDGPFAETREQLGGFYLLDCANLDDALTFAAKIPGAKDGCVEVRPVMDVG